MRTVKMMPRRAQIGSVLLEALISVLIFFIGLIALVGISSQGLNQVGQSRSRNEASYLAGELIGDMWTSAALPSAFNTASWLTRVQDTLPAGNADVQVSGTQVTITICWVDKREATGTMPTTVTCPPAAGTGPVTHFYATTAEIARN